MATNSTKSARFISLLPTIYSKLIVSGATHTEVSDWLNEEHNIELKGRTFSNYLSKYGDIKTAKASFDKEARKKNVASSWANSANNEKLTQVKAQTHQLLDASTEEAEITNATEVVNLKDEPPQVKRSVRISDQLGIKRQPNSTKTISADSLLDGYEESNSL